MGETPIGYVGVVRPGHAAAAREALGARMLAQVSDTATGKLLDLARPSHTMDPATDKPLDLGQPDPGTLSKHFSQWSPVYPQPRESQLRSCDITLSDRPAARPLIASAVTAIAQHRYVKSASILSSEVDEMLISDNPVAANSVIVTLLVPGAAYPNPAAAGGPTLHHHAAYAVIENESTAQATGVAWIPQW